MESSRPIHTSLQDRYLIERELGSGGMATVFLARDLRHNRSVAIKVLRDELTASLGKERFLREISIAAALTHPHILPLHDSGEAGGLLYYVMPYVEGRSLRERLEDEGELPIGDAARLLRDIADALAEAHRHGVVHRDLKPENVMLRGRHAVVTDFGVAKALSEATGRQVVTTIGVAIGTPTYMSPEQAVADAHLDHRSDIYSFGVLAYEVLTGQPPFAQLTPAEVMAAHVTRPPAPILERRPSLPEPVAAAVMRCLEKRPADRWQHADELVTVFEEYAATSGGRTPTATVPLPAATAPSRRRRRVFVSAGLGAIIAASAALYALTTTAAMPEVENQSAVTSGPELEVEPELSTDGRLIAFVQGPLDSARVMVRQVDGGQAVALTGGGEGAERYPQWMRDGSRVAFLRAGAVWSAPALGGSPSVLIPAGDAPIAEFAVSPATDRIALLRGGEIIVRALTGASDSVTLDKGVEFMPRWSPDGRRLAFVSGNSQYSRGVVSFGNLGPSAIWIWDLESNDAWPITDSSATNASPAWTANGRRMLFVSNRGGRRDVYAVDVPRAPAPVREPSRLTTGALPHSISLSADNARLVYSAFNPTGTVFRVRHSQPGVRTLRDAEQLTWESASIEAMHVSADERWLYYDAAREGRADVYRLQIGTREPIRLTDHPADDFMPHPSPDGRQLVFQSIRAGTRDVFLMNAEGGEPTVLAGTELQENYPRWSPTGRAVAFNCAGICVVTRTETGWSAPRKVHTAGSYPAWATDERSLVATAGRAAIRVDLSSGSVDTLYATVPGSGTTLLRVDVLPDGRHFILKLRNGRRTDFVARPFSGGRERVVLTLSADEPSFRSDFGVGRDYLYFTIDRRESDIWQLSLRWP